MLSWTRMVTLSDHVEYITNKANRALGLLIRTFQSACHRCILNIQAILAVYNANVRSVLEYCSVIWGGAAKSHVFRVERIHHKYLMWLAMYSESNCASLEYSRLLSLHNIQHLYARRAHSDIMFVCRLFKGFISSAHLLECFSIHVPASSTRGAPVTLFSVPSASSRWSRVNTVVNSLFVRGPRLLNDLMKSSPTCDIFHDTLGQIRRHVIMFTSSLHAVL